MAGLELPGRQEEGLSAGKHDTAGAFLAVLALYFVFFEGLAGATPGKRVCGLRVIAVGGETPGLGRSALRNALRLVDSLPAFNILGVVLILASAERARFGDRLGRTRVIVAR